MTRVHITPGTCSGTGLCAFYAPGTVDLNDEGRVTLLATDGTVGEPEGGDTVDDLRSAVEACPTRSITVETADTPA